MTIYYKGFNRVGERVDAGECRGFTYEEGKTYECERFKLCKEGFHFCKDLALTFQYYCFSKQKIYAEVEVLGNVEFEMPTKHKGVTDKIKIIRFLSHDEVVRVIDDKNNSGYRNSGYRNSGYENSGDGNSGYGNSGDGNSGYGNSGDGNSGRWNATNNNSGHFCVKPITKIMVFDKETTVEAYNKCYEPRFLLFKPDSNYKESFIKSWNKSNKEDRARITEMVNFDYDVFFELSGIKPETIKNNVNQEV